MPAIRPLSTFFLYCFLLLSLSVRVHAQVPPADDQAKGEEAVVVSSMPDLVKYTADDFNEPLEDFFGNSSMSENNSSYYLPKLL